MNWEAALCRQAIAEWRDRQILQASAMLNGCAGKAQVAFEAQLADARLIDAVWDPARFAYARLDELMRPAVESALPEFRRDAARELAALSTNFAALADALARADRIAWPQAPAPEPSSSSSAASPYDKRAAVRTKTPDRLLKLGQKALAQSPLGRGAAAVGERARNGLLATGSAAERLLQDRTGAHQRLRAAAAERVATQWMGRPGEQSVLGQIIILIDEVAASARTSTL